MSHSPSPQNVWQVLKSVLGITFKRQSPERLVYSRQRLVTAVLIALIAAMTSHLLFFEMSLNEALMKLVFELGVLVVALNLAWSPALPSSKKTNRHRLLKMTLALFLLSALGDLALTLLGAMPLESSLGPPRQVLAVLVMLAQLLGALNSVRFGAAVGWALASAYVAIYLAASLLLYQLAASFL